MTLHSESFASGNRDAHPLSLLHGVTRCGLDFSPLIASLTTRFHVTTVDLRGHGGSARADSYLVRDYVEDIVALVRSFERPCVLFGHSLGAMAALGAAAAEPSGIRAIILEDPPLETMGRRIGETPWRALFSAMRAIAEAGGSVRDVTERLGNIEVRNTDGRVACLRELRDAASLRYSASALLRMDPQLLTPVIDGCWLDGFDAERAARQVQCPALLLQADPDCGGALTHSDADMLSTAIRDCTRLTFARCGHQVHAMETQRVLNVVHAFASSL